MPGSDTINVQGINGAAVINAGGSDDIINVGSMAPSVGGTVNEIDAPLTINGEDGIDTLNVDDSGDAVDNTGNLTDTKITGFGMHDEGITYGTLEHLNIWLGEGDDEIDASTATRDLVISGGRGNDTIISGSGDDLLSGNEDDDVIIGGLGADVISGDTGKDFILGDVGTVDRNITDNTDPKNPRFRTLDGIRIYSEGRAEDTQPDGEPMVNQAASSWPIAEHPVPAWASWDIVLDGAGESEAEGANGSNDDYIAGGSDNDMIFGQLGDDIIQGDGSIALSVSAQRLDYGSLSVTASEEDYAGEGTDGDDYIEGNTGGDVIFGNLGQDDIIGGSSSLFGLNEPVNRPDGADIIFGGAGTVPVGVEDGRDDPGDGSSEGHARDADMILGDNGNIFRLVESDGNGGIDYLTFEYDKSEFGYSETLKIIPRAAELLDYTPGGTEYDPTAALAANDIGEGDEIHGESGDDFIYGQVGGDFLFGEGQDDDIIGGYGNDWISGGTGQDGVLGDDGRIYTSRNGVAEPLYGIAATEMEYISTPGKIQESWIHTPGDLKKTVNLTPFKLGPDDLDYAKKYHDPQEADDIIYGGLGSDFLHGGDGDDLISGAEAISEAYFEKFGIYDSPDDASEGTIERSDYTIPYNPGNSLGFEARKGEEFAAYDEFEPRLKILLDGKEYFANFDAFESDGDDRIFGDVGNDWLVGGTGQDHIYGGYGNDLLNADDDLMTNGGLNDAPDGPNLSYEDIAFGGAGRDVLIANTAGDRLIDWVGNFNTYLVPFSTSGMATISRVQQPQLAEYLYDLSESDGTDPTRAADTGADAERNGEPEGELGLVRRKDPDYHDQSGAPADPMIGNIPGGPRDVLRSAAFNSGQMEGFFTDSGVFEVQGGVLQVAAESLGGDAVSVYHVNDYLPNYFEIRASIATEKPTGGWKANSYVIFDYQNEYVFKFAGINISTNKIQLGHRDEAGWHIDVQSNVKVKPDVYYDVLVAINGTNVTVVVDDRDYFSHTFAPRVDTDGFVYGINDGMVGFGSDNSRGSLDNIAVQILPPDITLEGTEEFPNTNGIVDFIPASGSWLYNGGRYDGTIGADSEIAFSQVDLGIDHGLDVTSALELETTFNTQATGGLIFDQYGMGSFKFAVISAETDQLIIGHHTNKKGWNYDAAFDIDIAPGTDYVLNLSLKGTTVSASIKEVGAQGWQAMVGFVFNAVNVDGNFGLLSKDGLSSFDAVTVKTNDPAFQEPDDASPMLAASAPADSTEDANSITYAELDPVIDAAVNRWSESTLFDEAMLARLDDVTFLIADLTGDTLALAVDDTVIIDVDAAGHGWFADDTPYQDTKFIPQGNDEELAANEASNAYGDMDLLTVVMHELGHVFGYQDLDAENNDFEIMSDTLDEGVRYLPEDTFTGQNQENTDPLISLDLTPDETTAQDDLNILVNNNPWLIKYLVDGANQEDDPNGDIAVVLNDDGDQDTGDVPADLLPNNNGKGKKK
jgi:Ca2+-binding RTX toxin-like protein